MYISNIKIKNFRNFKDNDITFNEGVNVIIGHNNAGKSNLLRERRQNELNAWFVFGVLPLVELSEGPFVAGSSNSRQLIERSTYTVVSRSTINVQLYQYLRPCLTVSVHVQNYSCYIQTYLIMAEEKERRRRRRREN